MTAERRFDVVVIGAGPAGSRTAAQDRPGGPARPSSREAPARRLARPMRGGGRTARGRRALPLARRPARLVPDQRLSHRLARRDEVPARDARRSASSVDRELFDRASRRGRRLGRSGAADRPPGDGAHPRREARIRGVRVKDLASGAEYDERGRGHGGRRRRRIALPAVGRAQGQPSPRRDLLVRGGADRGNRPPRRIHRIPSRQELRAGRLRVGLPERGREGERRGRDQSAPRGGEDRRRIPERLSSRAARRAEGERASSSGDAPWRAALNALAADGFVAVGEAANQNNPFSGRRHHQRARRGRHGRLRDRRRARQGKRLGEGPRRVHAPSGAARSENRTRPSTTRRGYSTLSRTKRCPAWRGRLSRRAGHIRREGRKAAAVMARALVAARPRLLVQFAGSWLGGKRRR